MHSKAFYKKLTASVMALGLAFSFCACSGSSYEPTKDTRTSEQMESEAIQRNNKKIRDTINKLLGFNLSDEFIEDSELLIDATVPNSRGNICILVKQGKEEDLLAVLEKQLGMEKNIGPNLIPDTYKNQYAEELKKMNPIKNWEVSGMNIYLARNGTVSYLYIFS